MRPRLLTLRARGSLAQPLAANWLHFYAPPDSRLLYSGRMQPLDIFAAVAGICAFGLALYESIGKGEYAASGLCFGLFILCSVVLLFSRKAAQQSGKGGHVQRQRSGHNSTNIQVGGDLKIGGDKDGK
jgi:hypothetical protein